VRSWVVSTMYRTTAKMASEIAMKTNVRVSFFCAASSFWAVTISFPLPAGTTRIFGSFGSSAFG